MVRATRDIDRYALLALFLTIFAWAPLLGPQFFEAHDVRQTLFFTVEFFQGIADGYFYPRWGPDFGLGRGYPIFVFYPPLSLYVTQSFRFVGMGVVASVKVAYAIAFLLGTAGMYRLARRWLSRQGALIAGLAYTYLPYHLVDIYVRSAFAEFWALALFPWTLLAAVRLVATPSPSRIAGFALTYGGLILMHSPTALLFTPVLGLFMLHELHRRWGRTGQAATVQSVASAGAGIALALLITVGYWLPNLAEQQYIPLEQWVGGNYQFERQFIYVGQLLSSFWGFGYAVGGANDGMSFQLGIVGVGLGIFACWHLLRGTFDRERKALVMLCTVALVGALFAMTPASAPFWRALPLARFVQFPWRLLAPALVMLALLSGTAADAFLLSTSSHADSIDSLTPATVVTAGLLLLASFPYTVPRYAPAGPRQETALSLFDMEYEHPDMIAYLATTPVQPTDSPLISQYEAGQTPEKVRLLRGEGRVRQTTYTGLAMEAVVEAKTPVTVEIITYLYPGWRAWIDGTPASIRQIGPHGHMAIDMPAGRHHLVVRFTDTPLRRYATLASAVGVLAAVGLVLYRQDR